jgi:glucan-binding YG repeat protein
MSKNIKRAIIFTIICTAFSTWAPSAMNKGNQCAYAYSNDEITNLKISSGFLGIPIYSSGSYKDEYKIRSGDTVPVVAYSKISSDKTNIKLSTIETKAADIRVFVGNEQVKLADIYSAINIAEGEKKSIYIRLYNSKNAADSKYTEEYKLIVEREVSDEDDTETIDDTITLKQYDDIYLDNLVLYNNTQGYSDQIINFSFDKTKPLYDINVDEEISYIRIKAVPEQQSYKLIINDKDVDTHGDDKYQKEIQLDKGKNLIKIRIVSDDHKYREYYLNVTRGKSTSTSNMSNSTTNNTSSQNMQMVGNWLYKKADGTLATGWTLIGNDWYYFDLTGAMKTGWLQDASGKWYYLKESGVMAKNTVINGYKIGPDGTYVNK